MEQNVFFKWLTRVNSILFLLLLVSSIGLVFYAISESGKWGRDNRVEVTDKKANEEKLEDLRLGSIEKVCGTGVQYVRLMSRNQSKGFSSGGYGSPTRNLIFFVGKEMKSHWLFDTNSFLISRVDVLKSRGDDCKERKAVSIYYQLIKADTNRDGELDSDDKITIALTTPDGLDYKEIAADLTSVIDHSVNAAGTELTVLVQQGNLLKMKKFSLHSGEKISEREFSRINKKM